ncbi:hypothetical protein G7K71_13525 [Desulfofundulus sp. TPOSR]|uniref:hypothetical protein n=1 Tax=Desulfofundulus sp. TPOSR TaxID=2714340 RepID=UPI001409EE78|nr:hypothetical protein [Desulfofundulus sp. TPOSR]NHM27978.1 hypothetical protein [Desulfofundulus sp. TPOSR]
MPGLLSEVENKLIETATAGTEIPCQEPGFSEREALAMFREAVARAGAVCGPGVLEWCRDNRPDLWEAVSRAERDFDTAYRAGDAAGCRRACGDYVAAFEAMVREHAGASGVRTSADGLKARLKGPEGGDVSGIFIFR